MKQRSSTQPNIYNLDGPAGNAYAVIGYVNRMLHQLTEESEDKILEILDDMQSDDYLHLLTVADGAVGHLTVWETDNEEYLNVLNN